MEKRFVYFSKKENFLKATQGTEYEFTSIVFIGDSKEIWNRGIFYGTPEDFDINDYLTKADAASTYQPVGNYLTEHQSLADYAKTSEVNSKLEGYYTKEEVDAAIEGVDVTDQLVDYAKTADVDKKITDAKAEVVAKIPSLDGYATETWVENKGYETVSGAAGKYQPIGNYLTEVPDTYATKAYADKAASDAIDKIVDGATEAMDTLKEVEEALKTSSSTVEALNEAIGKKADKTYVDEQLQGKVDNSAITDMATQTWVESKKYLQEHQSLENYPTKSEVTSEIATEIGKVEAKIPSLEGYATEQWVENKNYLTQHQSLTEYAKKTELNSAIEGLSETYYSKEEVDDMWEWAEY